MSTNQAAVAQNTRVMLSPCFCPTPSKVQPDLEELNLNMEDNEGISSANTSVEYLGKLHYSLDYNFQTTEVTS